MNHWKFPTWTSSRRIIIPAIKNHLPNSSAPTPKWRRAKNPTSSANLVLSAPRKWRRRCRRLRTAVAPAACSGACASATATAAFTGTANPDWAAIFTRPSTGPVRPWAMTTTKSTHGACPLQCLRHSRPARAANGRSRAAETVADRRCGRDFLAGFGRRERLSSRTRAQCHPANGRSLPPTLTRRSRNIVRSSPMKMFRAANGIIAFAPEMNRAFPSRPISSAR